MESKYVNKERDLLIGHLFIQQIVANKQLDDLIISKHYISTVPLFVSFKQLLKAFSDEGWN
jgi:hypothetical protein